MNSSRNLKIAGAILVPPLLAYLGTASAYWSGTIANNWPLTLISMLFGLMLGLYFVLSIENIAVNRRRWLSVAYVPICVAAMYVTGFFTACSFGDCL